MRSMTLTRLRARAEWLVVTRLVLVGGLVGGVLFAAVTSMDMGSADGPPHREASLESTALSGLPRAREHELPRSRGAPDRERPPALMLVPRA